MVKRSPETAKKAPTRRRARSAADIVAEVVAETPSELSLVDQVREAHQQRLTGASWSEVADRAGYDTPQNAMLAVNSFLQRAAIDQAFEVGQLALTMELARLDELQSKWWKLATAGDKDAAKIVLDIIKQRTALLKLTATEKITERQTIIITSTDDMAEQLQRMALGQRPGELPGTHGG